MLRGMLEIISLNPREGSSVAQALGSSRPSRKTEKGSGPRIAGTRFGGGSVCHPSADIEDPDIHRYTKVHASGPDGTQPRPPLLKMGQFVNCFFMTEMDDIMESSASLRRKIRRFGVDQIKRHDETQQATQGSVFRIRRG